MKRGRRERIRPPQPCNRGVTSHFSLLFLDTEMAKNKSGQYSMLSVARQPVRAVRCGHAMAPSARIDGANSQGMLVLIIGPSGVGKSVVLRELKRLHPEFVFPRSATTRQRRTGEGEDLYRFVSDAEFDRLVAQAKVLEWARVHDGPPDPDGAVRAGARYGTLEEEIVPPMEQGKVVVREVDVQGFHSIREHALFSGAHPRFPLRSVFILPERREQLIERIRRRAPIAEEELQRRIASMDREIADASLCTARIVNHDGKLGDTVREVEKVIGA